MQIMQIVQWKLCQTRLKFTINQRVLIETVCLTPTAEIVSRKSIVLAHLKEDRDGVNCTRRNRYYYSSHQFQNISQLKDSLSAPSISVSLNINFIGSPCAQCIVGSRPTFMCVKVDFYVNQTSCEKKFPAVNRVRNRIKGRFFISHFGHTWDEKNAEQKPLLLSFGGARETRSVRFARCFRSPSPRKFKHARMLAWAVSGMKPKMVSRTIVKSIMIRYIDNESRCWRSLSIGRQKPIYSQSHLIRISSFRVFRTIELASEWNFQRNLLRMQMSRQHTAPAPACCVNRVTDVSVARKLFLLVLFCEENLLFPLCTQLRRESLIGSLSRFTFSSEQRLHSVSTTTTSFWDGFV